jgi:hypothetical protein
VGLPIGVSVLCPGWVRAAIMDAYRNWPERLGDAPPRAPANEVTRPHFQRAIDEGMEPAAVADLVADAIVSERFWVLRHPELVENAVRRWPHRQRRKSRSRGRRAWISAHHTMDERDSRRAHTADRLGKVVMRERLAVPPAGPAPGSG